MKHIAWVVIFSFIFLSATAQSVKEIKNDTEEARETKDEFFIDLRNGKRIKYNSLKLKIPFGGGSYLEADGQRTGIDWDSVKAFQTDKFYSERFYDCKNILIDGNRLTMIQAQRLRNGKIELFTASVYSSSAYGSSGGGYIRHLFVRKGKGGEIYLLSRDILKGMIADNKSLLEEFDKMFKNTNKYKSATKILDEYN